MGFVNGAHSPRCGQRGGRLGLKAGLGQPTAIRTRRRSARHGRRPVSDAVQRRVRHVDHAAGAVPGPTCITNDVAGIEMARLAVAGAGHPLPTQVVAGQVAIQQMAVEPVRDRAQVHDVARQPHARMVVQQTRGVQRAHRHVDGRHASAGLADVIGQRVLVRAVRQRPFVQGLQDALTAVPRRHAGQHIRQTDEAVREVG